MNVTTGSFLVARPILTDPNFAKSVVFILAYGSGGAYGVVVNRPVANPDLPVPLFQGGPCQGPGLVMLHGQPEWVEESAEGEGEGEGEEAEGREVAPGVFVGDAQCLSRATKPAPGQAHRFRIFHGYAGWGPGQLDQEIASGAWMVVPASGDMLFDVPAEEQWATLYPCRIPEPSLN